MNPETPDKPISELNPQGLVNKAPNEEVRGYKLESVEDYAPAEGPKG